MFQIHRLLLDSYGSKNPSNEVDGLNSVISPVMKKVAPLPKKASYVTKLESNQKQTNIVWSRRELPEVVLFEVLNSGCKHACAEQFLLTGNA